MNWYYVQAGQQRGPVTETDLPQLVANRIITPTTLVWHEGMANWQAYQDIAGPVPTLPAPEPIPGATASEAAPPVGDVVCSECHQIFPAENVIRYGSVFVCANCKPTFVQRLREGAAPVGATGQTFAGFWLRLAAYVIDNLIVGVVNFFVSLLVVFLMPNRSMEAFSVGQGITFLISMVLALIYEAWFLVNYSATPGKMAMHLKVVSVEGVRITWGRAIGRYFAKLLSGCPTLFIGFIMAGTDEHKRALHDRICNTRVIVS